MSPAVAPGPEGAAARLEEAFVAATRRHPGRSPAAAAFASRRWREGRRLHAHLAARYPAVVRPGAEVLDLGCGNGGFSLPFAAAGCRVRQLDVHPHDELAAVLRAAGPPAVHLVGRGEALPFPAAALDLVLLIETLEHLPRPLEVGREVARVLRPGGLVLVTTPPRLRFLLRPDPHYGMRGLLLLPDGWQRRWFARRRPDESYDVVHTYWSVAGLMRDLPGLAVTEITSRNWAGPLRRLDWDWVVARKPVRPAA